VGIKSILGNSFDLVRHNLKIGIPSILFSALISIIAVVFIGGAFVGSAFSGNISAIIHGTATTQAILQLATTILTAFAALIVVAYLIGILLCGTYVAIAEQGCKKQGINLGRAFGVVKANYLRLLGAGLVFFVIELIVLAVFGALFYGVYLMHSPVLDVTAGALLAIVALIACVIIDIFAFQVYAVVIIEKRGSIDAVKRSIEIGMSKWRNILGVIIALILVAIGVTIVIDIIGVVLALIPILGTLLSVVVNFILSALLTAWIELVPVYFYHEYVARSRRR
jgi:hypothetical protein